MIYIKKGEYGHGRRAYPLIRRALALYLKETGKTDENSVNVNQIKIDVYDSGKPYFRNSAVEFSLSHSGDWWAVAFSGAPLGIDIQKIDGRDHSAVAGRWFGEAEKAMAEAGGEAFFRIWTMKEACAKMTGQGFFDASGISVIDGASGEVRRFRYGGREYGFSCFDIRPGLKCALCSADAGQPQVRTLE